MEQFHFLRPQWLLALAPLALGLLWLVRNTRITGAWPAACDPHLVPHVLEPGSSANRRRNVAVLGLVGVLTILALAGPAWRQLPQPVYRQQSALVVMLDLSRSMDARDLEPSRLERARLKLLDLLRARREGQTALIAYAGDAFVVTPLTDDSDTIAALVQGLTTDIMPLEGSRADRAVQQGLDLLSRVGARNGSLLLITDGVAAEEVGPLAEMVRGAGHRLSVLGVGTADGAPVPDPAGGFVKDGSGHIVIPRLDQDALVNLAQRSGGVYARLEVGDGDIQRILAAARPFVPATRTGQGERETDRWREEGPWLLLLLLPAVALAFRRGVLAVVLILGLPWWPGPAHALDWDGLWLKPDQRGARAMARQDFTGAAQAFEDPGWKAAALYRAGEYDQALKYLQDMDTPDAIYNRGNALARLGRISEAIDSYEQVLARDPGNADAKHNLEVLKNLRKPQSKPSGSSSDGDGRTQNGQQQNQQGQRQQQQNQQGQNEQRQNGQRQNEPRQGGQQPAAAGEQAAGDAAQRERSSQSGVPQERGTQASASDREHARPPGEVQAQRDEGASEARAQVQSPPQNGQQEGANDRRQAAAEPGRLAQTEQQRATEQWLRRIPDDPAGLLRRKFRYQYSQRYRNVKPETQPW